MKTIPLTNSDRVALVDDEDYDRVAQYKWFLSINKRGNFVRQTTAPNLQLVRFLLNTSVECVIHKDKNILNFQKYNLIAATIQQTHFNEKLKITNTSGYKGVHFHKARNKYHAYITYDNTRYFLGYYDSREEAALAYDAAATELFGKLAFLNFPDREVSTKFKTMIQQKICDKIKRKQYSNLPTLSII